jgi:hypothetical protein
MYRLSIFISHSWAYPEHYEKLVEWIFRTPWNVSGTTIEFTDVSIPKDNPIHNATNDSQLKAAIFTRIRQADVVVIPTGMYANYSNWIRKEIEGAQAYGKPILAVNPWAQERKSSVVAAAANQSVGWNMKTVVNGIWSLVRR